MNNRKATTPEQIYEARRLRGLDPPWGWNKIALHLNIKYYSLRCELDSAYRERETNRTRESHSIYRERKKKLPGQQRYPTRPLSADDVQQTTRLTIPHDVLADRDARMALAPQSITAMLMGDPIPGLSALGQRRAR